MSDSPVETAVSSRALSQWLQDWGRAGMTHLPRLVPTGDVPEDDIPVAAPEAVAAVPAMRAVATIAAPATADHPESDLDPRTLPSMPARRPVGAVPAAAAASLPPEERLAALARQVADCTRCRELAETRKQTVFGVGNPRAQVMFIGEAPGADEDAQGEPFVGRAGQLLNKIIAACGWRREDLYICNILRCRPPGNRNPSEAEAANCREYLDGQIATVDPEYIVCWGTVAARNLLGTEDPIGRLRGNWYQYGRAQVLCTYHPSYLLRNPAAKKPVWEDMQLLLRRMGLEPPVG